MISDAVVCATAVARAGRRGSGRGRRSLGVAAEIVILMHIVGGQLLASSRVWPFWGSGEVGAVRRRRGGGWRAGAPGRSAGGVCGRAGCGCGWGAFWCVRARGPFAGGGLLWGVRGGVRAAVRLGVWLRLWWRFARRFA